MRNVIKIFSFLIIPAFSIFPQNESKIMSYNLLNYPGSDSTIRNPYFRTTISSVNPDILVVQEMASQVGVDGLLSKVMNSFGQIYTAGTFIDGYDTDNAIFFKASKFNFLSNIPIHTVLRDINEFKLVYKTTNDTIRIYSVHLKASSGSANEILRTAEVDSLRKVTDELPLGSNFMVVGDYNIYRYSELAFQKLLNQSNSGYFIDPLNLIGDWGGNSLFAQFHTQSPRTRSFGGGATGGMDDRFDMILISQAVNDSGGVQYVPASLVNYGNDGLHFNDSINHPPNNAVGQTIADALHYSSDHLPVFASFKFDGIVPVEIDLLNASVIDNDVLLKWITATEINNLGFYIERRKVKEINWTTIGFVPGNGTSTNSLSYEFKDNDLPSGKYEYRLKQIDYDGSFEYSLTITADIHSPVSFALEQNYPNPFNPKTIINYFIPEETFVTIKVFDVLGNEVTLLVNEIKQPGEYRVLFFADKIASGFYFYQMRAGNFVETKKMILMR